MKNNLKKNIFLALVCIVLFFLIFKWIGFLFLNNYIVECFTNENYTHTVDLPLTTTYSCQNFCNSSSRCAITGQQCLADIDCPGCNPGSTNKENKENKEYKESENIPGNDDSGKLTVGITPQYSQLTNGYGTKERIITSDFYSKPPTPNFGLDLWTREFQEEVALFNKRYKPKDDLYNNYNSYNTYKGAPLQRYSLSGRFIDDGPFPSNAKLD